MSDPAQLLRDWIATYDTPTTSVAHFLCDRHDPDTIATTEIGPTLEPTTLTYGQLRERSQTLATGLAHRGIQPGDRIATLLPKGIDLTVTALATWRLGAVLVHGGGADGQWAAQRPDELPDGLDRALLPAGDGFDDRAGEGDAGRQWKPGPGRLAQSDRL